MHKPSPNKAQRIVIERGSSLTPSPSLVFEKQLTDFTGPKTKQGPGKKLLFSGLGGFSVYHSLA